MNYGWNIWYQPRRAKCTALKIPQFGLEKMSISIKVWARHTCSGIYEWNPLVRIVERPRARSERDNHKSTARMIEIVRGVRQSHRFNYCFTWPFIIALWFFTSAPGIQHHHVPQIPPSWIGMIPPKMRPSANWGQGRPLEALIIPCMGWASAPLPHPHHSHGWMTVPSPSHWFLKDRNITVSTIYPSVRLGGWWGWRVINGGNPDIRWEGYQIHSIVQYHRGIRDEIHPGWQHPTSAGVFGSHSFPR